MGPTGHSRRMTPDGRRASTVTPRFTCLSRSSNIISIGHLTHNVSCAIAKASNRVELLILDDPGLATLTPEQGRDLLEIVDNRRRAEGRRPSQRDVIVNVART